MRRTTGGKEVAVNVVGSSTFGRYPKISSELAQNLFVSDEFLIGFPGYQRVAELLSINGEGRGLFRSFRANIMVAVVNAYVIRIDTALGLTVIGLLETQSGEVVMDENLNGQICIVDGLNAYIYNHTLAPNLTKQTAGALSNGQLIPNYVCFHNTYFLFGNGEIDVDGAAWFAYLPDAATTIKQLTISGQDAFFTLSTKSDFAIAVQRIPGQSNNVLVFGTSVCEVHTNVSDTQVYRRNSSISVDYGCLSVNTISSSDSYVVWLGVNETNAPAIMIYTGQGAESISTDGIDHLMAHIKFPDQSSASFVWKEGHLFYVLTFHNPADNLTLAYDFTEKKFCNLTDGDNNFFPARQFVYFNQNTYFINIVNGDLYKLDSDITVYDDNIPTLLTPPDPRLIQIIPRVRIVATVRSPDTQPFRANSFTFTMDMGNDNIDPDVPGIDYIISEDGKLMLSEDGQSFIISDDSVLTSYAYQGAVDLSISTNSGETWSNFVRRLTNPLAHRQNIIRWESMGFCNEWTAKLFFWTKGRICVYNGILEIF